MHNIGTIEERRGNREAARDWFTKAAATRNTEAAQSAAGALARLAA
jgi:hypothetical protein